MPEIIVDVGVDIINDTYTLIHYIKLSDGITFYFDEITLPIQELVADTVLVTSNGLPISIEKIPDELYAELANFLQAKEMYLKRTA